MTHAGLKVELRPVQSPAARLGARQPAGKSDFFSELSQARREAPQEPAKTSPKKAERESQSADSAASRADVKADRARSSRREESEAAAESIEPTADNAELDAPDEVAVQSEDDLTKDEQAPGEEAAEEESDEPSDAALNAAAALQAAPVVMDEQSAELGDSAEPEGGAAQRPVIAAAVVSTAGQAEDDQATTQDAVAPDDAVGVPADVLAGLELGDEAVLEVAPERAPLHRGTRQSHAGGAEVADATEQPAIAGKPLNAEMQAIVDPTAMAVDGQASPTGTAAQLPSTFDLPDGINTLLNSSPTPRAAQVDATVIPAAAQRSAEAQFAEANHAKIVSGVNGQLTSNGGSMQLRLDPPHLGPLAVSVHMRDGVVTASFETQNDDATKLLSHSLGQLKSALEAQGISVDKLQVQQAPKDQQASDKQNDSRQNQQGLRDGPAEDQQQQKQRQEMLRRMWQRVNGDPIDLVA
ncbi:MAG TPA: flagellar hook-length control protein FliK [Tepidisphaeraceae bacterium]|jgi:flagellar hook-length control protein FliK|nr:flagellar hook-length control protein FliK [Tepidisphaeraceae bacterium]